MKGVVVYDSVYGNTKQVAEAIAEQIRVEGHEAELRSLRESHPEPPKGDFMFVGSPTRIGNATRKARRFAKKLSASDWHQQPIVPFDTVMPMPTDEKQKEKARKYIERSASHKLEEILKAKGLNVKPVLRFTVTGMKGPLAEGAIEDAKRLTHEFIATLAK